MIMIVQIVLVIVTAVQVDSQGLCPSVCQCNGEHATCENLFSNVQNVMQHRFQSGLVFLQVFGTSRLELEEDRFLRWNITTLTILDVSENNITRIWVRAFYSLAYLKILDLSVNSITVLHPQTFQKNVRLHSIYLNENKITSLDPNLFKNTVQLWKADLHDNRITELHPSTFRNNSRLMHLYVTGNKINSIQPDTFLHNTDLQWLDLNRNSLTDVHPSTFRNNSRLANLHMSNNKLNSIQPDTFLHNTELIVLDLHGNRITDVPPSTFRNNIQLIYLDISRNKITLINPDTFIHNKKLRTLYLQANNITDISNSSFSGLEQLEKLDLSNNNILELNPLVFHNTLTSTNQQNHKVSNLKQLNLAQNMIRSFNFELYFPSSSNSDISNPTFQLEYLNLSSNLLTTLGAASVKWLNHTTAATDLTANPWNCDCSVLLEVWRELKHKLTLNCSSPRRLQGKTWDVLEGFCLQVAEDINYKSNISDKAVSQSKERNEDSGVNYKNGGPSGLTTTLIVTGVVLVCAIGGSLILTKVVMRLRKRTKTPEYCDAYAPSASYVSDHLYEEVG